MRSRVVRFIAASLALAALVVGPTAITPGRVSAALDAQGCINALRADRSALEKLVADQNANFNRTTSSSPLAIARKKYTDAIWLRGDDYYDAYKYAYQGKKTTANTWITKGNTATKTANSALATINAQIKVINTATDRLNAQQDALDTQMTQTDQACLGF